MCIFSHCGSLKIFQVPGIKNGSYKLRVHMNTPSPKDLQFNGIEISQQLKEVCFLAQGKFLFFFFYLKNIDISLISPQKCMLWVLIRSSSLRHFL